MIILQHLAISKVLSPPGCKPATLLPVNLGGGMLLGRLQICSMLVPGAWNQACLLPHCIPRAREKMRKEAFIQFSWLTAKQNTALQRAAKHSAATFHIEQFTVNTLFSPLLGFHYWESTHFTKTKWHRRLNWCCWFWKHFFPLNTVCCSFKRSTGNESVVNRNFLKYWFWDYRFVFIFIQLNSAK